jgi:hypothetical protein
MGDVSALYKYLVHQSAASLVVVGLRFNTRRPNHYKRRHVAYGAKEMYFYRQTHLRDRPKPAMAALP